MKAPAFQFYADDFLAGVADMTQAEVGAYILLLCAQWSRGEIPTEPARASLIAKGEVSAHVMGKFPQGRNARMERERVKQDEYRAQKSDAGKFGANKRWHNHSTPIGSAIAHPMANGMANDSSPSPSPSSINTFISPDGAIVDEIYKAYPRKTAPAAARKAIAKAMKVKPAAELLEAARAYAAACASWPDDQKCYIPHPASWFNAGRYDDDRSTWARKPANGATPQNLLASIPANLR